MENTTQKKVEIYSTPTCHFCHLAKDWFTANNIEYINYDVSTDTDKRSEMIDITGQLGVPVIKIEEDVIIGFDQDKLKELLNIK